MSIPGGISVPGAELVLARRAVGAVARDAGRGQLRRPHAQHHRRAVAGQRRPAQPGGGASQRHHRLDAGRAGARTRPEPRARPPCQRPSSEADARRGGARGRRSRRRADGVDRASCSRSAGRRPAAPPTASTCARPRSTRAGHLAGFRSAPGGQLVQETDVFAPVRGARIVLWDDAGVARRHDRLVAGADGLGRVGARRTGHGVARARRSGVRPAAAAGRAADRCPRRWRTELSRGDVLVLDVAPSPVYLRGHIPGAWFVSRPRLTEAALAWPRARRMVVTSPDGLARALRRWPMWLRPQCPRVGRCGSRRRHRRVARTRAARSSREPSTCPRLSPTSTSGPTRAPTTPPAAMQAYLDWEYGLVAQLARDGTHGFFVI